MPDQRAGLPPQDSAVQTRDTPAPRFRTCQDCGGAGYYSCPGPCMGVDDLGCDVCEGGLYIDCDNCEATGLIDNEEYGDD